jgi:hypothetical protein
MRLVQAVVTLQRPGTELDTGGGGSPPVDDDEDDDGGDDDEWSWEILDARFKTQIQEWVKTSPVTGKIANILYENTFSKKPKIHIMRYTGGRKWGRLQMDLRWEYGGDVYDDFENEFKMILMKSDLYKVFGARPDQLWGILDKGVVFPWVIYYIFIGFTGRGMRSDSQADKQAAFQTYSFVTKNQEKYKKWIQKRLNPGVPLSITVTRPIASGGQIYNNDFVASGVVYWEYEPAG